MDDARGLVRAGYDAIAEAYLAVRDRDGDDVRLLDELLGRLPVDARILDAGCGAGEPVTRILSARRPVIGLDLSAAQLRLAQTTLADVALVQGDLAALPFRTATFDAVVSYYAIIHVPRTDHPDVLAEFRRVLRPGGLLLVSLGANDNPDDIDPNWLGAGAAMYWSHFGITESLRLVREAGFEIAWDRLIRESDEFGSGTHLFVLARSR
jgi:ubiquinone/menaquinone biosynthesis C-methylase UbiE